MKRTISLLMTIIVIIQLVTINIYAEDIEIPYDEYIKLLYDINYKEHREILDGLGLYTYSGTDIRPYNPSMFDFFDGSVKLHAEYLDDTFLVGFASMANELGYLAKKIFKSGDSVVIDVETYKLLKNAAYGLAVEYVNLIPQNAQWYENYYGYEDKIPQNSNWYISYYGRDNDGNRVVTIKDNSIQTIQIFGDNYKTLSVGMIYDVLTIENGNINEIIEGILSSEIPINKESYVEFLLISDNGEIYAQSELVFDRSGLYLKLPTNRTYLEIYTNVSSDSVNRLYKKDVLQIGSGDFYGSIYHNGKNKTFLTNFQNGIFEVTYNYDNYKTENPEERSKFVMGDCYINIKDDYNNLVYYTYDEIKNKNLEPYIAVKISNHTKSIKQMIKENTELSTNVELNNQTFTIPISEAEEMIERAIQNALIDENTKVTLQDGTIVKIDDKQLDEFKKLLEANNENSGTIIGLLEEILQTLINIRDYMTTGLEFTNPDGTTGKTSFWDFLSTISKGILNIVDTMTDGLLGIADTMSGGIFDLSGTLADGILEIGNTISEGLLELVNKLVDTLLNLLVPDEVEFQNKVTELRTEIDNKIPVINQLQSFTSDFTEFLQNESGFTEQEVSQQSIMLDGYNGIQTFTLIEPPEVIIPNEPPTDTYDAPSFSVNLYGSEIKIIDFDMFSKYRNAIHTIIIVLVYLGSSKKIIRKLSKIVE